MRSAELRRGQIFAGYRIDATAGRGGMGVVYRATQIARGRTVALKLLAPCLAEDRMFRARFRRESRLMSSIEHPHVVEVHEAGVAGGQPFISMRYVDGDDLRALIAGEGGLCADRAARIVAQIAGALDAAHAVGFVHRDVTPSNVLVERRSGREHAFLCDFGLSRSALRCDALTRPGRWVGTLDYVAPEQIAGRAVDARTDVYALGCVLFHALTGRAPFVADCEAESLWAHLHRPPPSACALRRELPSAVDAVIARAMAKDPAQRYGSAGELGRAAIAAACGAAATAAAHVVPADVAAPSARRRVSSGVRVAVAAAAAVALVAGTAVSLLRSDDTARAQIDHIGVGARTPDAVVADAGRVAVLTTGPPSRSEVLTVRRGRSHDAVIDRRVVSLGSDPAIHKQIALDPYDNERLWVLYRNADAVSAIDVEHGGRATLAVHDPVDVAFEPGGVAVVLSGGARPAIRRFDVRTLHRLGPAVRVGGRAVDVAYLSRPDAGGLVVTTDGPQLAVATYTDDLRPRQRIVVRRPGMDATAGERVTDVAIDAHRGVAWVLTPFDAVADGTTPQMIMRVDLVSGSVAGDPIMVGPSARDVAIDGGVAWVTSVRGGRIARLDARSGRALGKPIDVGPIDGAMSAAGGVVWIAGLRDVVRITPPCSGVRSCA